MIKRMITFLMAMSILSISVFAESPYSNYEFSTDNYNGLIASKKNEANSKKSPDAVSYVKSIRGIDFASLNSQLNNPEDFTLDDKGNIVICDSGNSRLVVINPEHSDAFAISGWQGENQSGDFKSATGIFFGNNQFYITLKENGIVLVFTKEEIISNKQIVVPNRMIESPDLSKVTDHFHFKPSKIVSDHSGRMYIIVSGTYDGLVSLSKNGDFLGYVGAERISLSAWQKFWRRFSTASQIDASEDTVPVEFYNIDIDENGFIFSTSKGEKEESTVRKINLIGNDVLKTGIYNIKGELSPLKSSDSVGIDSNLVDIDYYDGGIYSCLDNARGKIFTYNSEGDMIFAFGGLSAQKGAFSIPTAVQWQDDHLFVLDKGANELVTFELTDYGKVLISACKKLQKGEYGESNGDWKKVLKFDPNNEFANRNVGKIEYNAGNYKTAMEYFKISNDKKLYSKAYSKYRALSAQKYIPYIGVSLIALLIILLVAVLIRKTAGLGPKMKAFSLDVKKFNERNR